MSSEPAPLSKTAKYKKITKPLLERKRRARINRCLDELKDLMVGALEIDDDNLSKLEKADILELTVNHLTKLHSPKDPVVEAKKFQAGFGQCAAEACRFIMSVPDLDEKVSQNLISHLSRLITAQPLSIQVPERPPFSPPTSPSSVVSDRHQYYSDHERSSSDAEDSVYSSDGAKQWAYTRPVRAQPKPYPIAGLLTTVDKLQQPPQDHSGVPRNDYLNRVPAEAKDVILQKIRQHIMDKRGNENVAAADFNEHHEAKYVPKEEMYRGEYEYQIPYPSNNDTLDLRKIKLPAETAAEVGYLPKNLSHRNLKEFEPAPVQNKVIAPPTLPEHCESPMDYSNLPPKKKRKLIEYQEYKKQEEAKRRLDAFYAGNKDHQGPPADLEMDVNKWRPW
ncbi:protein hairy-like [Battus philenor]|uniref:protein hairy-like n=1 Tax=Battus philenor TaxID=42288 RepID=UPI0035D02612